MHFPQYLSYLITGKITSEYTSIGCHTAMWDFDNHRYHKWLEDEGIQLPAPVANDNTEGVEYEGHSFNTGVGIHDSSSSLVPYFMGTKDQFILISTGTWCIFMNPFNTEPLTAEQLANDSLCYMSIQQKQVKSSRLFMGHIHDVNVERLSNHFGVAGDQYKSVRADSGSLNRMKNSPAGRLFFKNGIPDNYIDTSVDLTRFLTFGDAYKQFMVDLVDVGMESLDMIIPRNDHTNVVYISGGFAKNELFTKLMALHLPDKKVYTSEIENATALGAAMVVWEKAFGGKVPDIDLGLKLIASYCYDLKI